MTKPATSIYGDKEFIDVYRKHVIEKLGLSLSARLFELAHQDDSYLTGKPVITTDESITKLSQRLESLTKRRDDDIKILRQHDTFDNLYNNAVDHYGGLTFEPPEREKQTITALLKAFKQGKITAGEDDLTLFLGLLEVSIERHQLIKRLSELRMQTYCGGPVAQVQPEDQPEPVQSEPPLQDEEDEAWNESEEETDDEEENEGNGESNEEEEVTEEVATE